MMPLLNAILDAPYRMFLFNKTLSTGYPLLRGKIHLLLVYLSPIWIGSLVRASKTRAGTIVAILASICALVNFACSAILHNGAWSPRRLAHLTKLDYAGIFVMISGSAIPVPILLCPVKYAVLWMTLQWFIAITGIVMILSNSRLSHSSTARAIVYVLVGLSNLLFFPLMKKYLTSFELICLLTMGTTYVVGACFYAMKKPNLIPGVFGFHELFHLMCFAAALSSYKLTQSVLRRAA